MGRIVLDAEMVHQFRRVFVNTQFRPGKCACLVKNNNNNNKKKLIYNIIIIIIINNKIK